MVDQDILRYLIAHPNAKDTMKGVFTWWLPADGRVWVEDEVQEALDALVARGWLTQRHTTTRQTLYGLNQEKLEEIQAFLRGHQSGAET